MLLSFLICAALVGADQWIKSLVAGQLAPHGHAQLIPGVVELRYYENSGAAFSILQGKQGLLIFITGIALVAGLVYILRFRSLRNRLEYVTFILIYAGGIGNLIDRISNGYVVDYLNLLFIDFAVFNLADIMVCVGFGLLVIAVIRSEVKLKKAEKALLAKEGGTNGGEEPDDDGQV